MSEPLTQELSEGNVHLRSRWNQARGLPFLSLSGGTSGTPPEHSLSRFVGRRLLVPAGGTTVLAVVTLRGKTADEHRRSLVNYLWGVPDEGEPVRLNVVDEWL
jgi:hypothetical protein